MSIIIGKLDRKTFTSEDGEFHLYMAKAGGERFTVVYTGKEPPEALKTVEVVLYGKWQTHPKHGKQFRLFKLKRYGGPTLAEQDEAETARHVGKITEETES